VAYLTDDLARLSNFIAFKIDTSNRPLVEFQQETTPLSAATGTLIAVGALTNTETVVVDGKTYTIQSSLTDSDGNVLQGATVSDTLNNLVAAITLGPGKGTLYAVSTTLHPTVLAARGAGDTMVVTAKTLGTSGNSITTTETTVNASWGGATLSGGAGTTTTQAAVTPGVGYPVVGENVLVHTQMKWDTSNFVDGVRHVSLVTNEARVPDIDWSTDPTSAWAHFVPTHLVLAGPALGDAEFNGSVVAAQLSESL
jgi:phosphatidylserine decarboxylase